MESILFKISLCVAIVIVLWIIGKALKLLWKLLFVALGVYLLWYFWLM